MIQDAINLCYEDIQENGISLTFLLLDNLPNYCADYMQMKQVVVNLVRNNIDISQRLPVNQPHLLSIHTQSVDDNGIMVRVKDNGPGMDKVQYQKISMPNYRTKAFGMRIELSIPSSLIEIHGSILYFNRKTENGPTFYFILHAIKLKNGM